MTSQQQWHARNHVALFVRCLHLLDLDMLEDWPGISEQSFSAKSNLQQRLKCVEWSMYRLFELYDSRICKEKLSPFFPPSTPLQSLNLRAALIRQLGELKKDGVLEGNVQLRKTMLDECKGERFEEAVCAFAMMVLRKVTNVASGGFSPTNSLSSLLPITLAYRVSLNRKLKGRNSIKLRNVEVHDALRTSLQTLQAQEHATRSKTSLTNNIDSQKFEELINSQWLGAPWRGDLVMNGQLSPSENPKSSTSDNDRIDIQRNNGAWMRDLDLRINDHNNKLRQWKAIYTRLKPLHPTIYSHHKPLVTKVNETPIFHRHQEIGCNSEIVLVSDTRPNLQGQYEALLRSMAKEIPSLHRSDGVESVSDFTATEQSLHRGVPQSQKHSFGRVKDATIMVEQQEAEGPLPAAEKAVLKHVFDPDTSLVSGIQMSNSKNFSSIEEVNRSPCSAVGIELPTSEPVNYLHQLRSNTARTPSSAASSENISAAMPDESELRPVVLSTPVEPPSYTEHNPSLQERATQSMLLSSKSIPGRIPASDRMQRSINENSAESPLDTPSRARTSTQLVWSPGSGMSTPRDQLFEENAEYASVFKSRPRIALSPAPSPQNVDEIEDSILGAGIQKLNSQ